MKTLILLSIAATLLLSNSDCNKKASVKYKGRLEIKALCMNYTISVLEGDMDPSKVEAEWNDEGTGKHYHNVFGLKSRCTFPDSIKQGDEFYFIIDSTAVQNCMVCMAYYPTPAKKLSIKVVDK